MDVRVCLTLSEAEECFVLNLCRGMAPTTAAMQAGLSMSTARLMFRKRHVQAAMRAIKANLDRACSKMELVAAGQSDEREAA